MGFEQDGSLYRHRTDRTTGIRCAACGGVVKDAASAHGPSAAWLYCFACGSVKSVMAHLGEVRKVDTAGTVKLAADHGLFPYKKTTERGTLDRYYAWVRARRSWDRFATAMQHRTVESMLNSAVHQALGIDRSYAHSPGSHWTTTPAEIADYLHGACKQSGRVVTALGVHGHTPVVALPVFTGEQIKRVCGVWVCTGTDSSGRLDWVSLSADGESGGVTAAGTQLGTWGTELTSYGKFGTLTFDPSFMVDVFKHLRNGNHARCVLAGGNIDAEFLAYVVRTADANFELVEHSVAALEDSGCGSLYVASRTGARIRTGSGDAVAWPRAVLRWAESTVRDYAPEKHVIADSWWGPTQASWAVEEGHLTEEEARRITVAVAHVTTGRGVRTIPIRRGLTVAIHPNAWIQEETSTVLMYGHLVVTRVYADTTGRRRWSGYYMAPNGSTAPFDSSRLRKDPAGVVEGACVRARLEPPRVHPALVPHLAHIALYLRGTSSRVT